MSVPPRPTEHVADWEVAGERAAGPAGAPRGGRAGLITAAIVLVVLLAAIALLFVW